MTRRRKAVDEADVLPVERERLEPLVAAIGDQQDRRRAASVDGQAVRAIELAGLLALAAEGADELRVLRSTA